MPFANNKGADQPLHPRSLIGAFFWGGGAAGGGGLCLDNINSRNFKTLTSLTVVEQAGVWFSRTHLKRFAALFISTPFGFKTRLSSVTLSSITSSTIFIAFFGS